MKKVIIVSIAIASFVSNVQAAQEPIVWQSDAQLEQEIMGSMRDREREGSWPRFGQDRYPSAGFGGFYGVRQNNSNFDNLLS